MKGIDPIHDDYIIDWDSVRWSNHRVTLSDPYELQPVVQHDPEDLSERLSGWPPVDLD